MEILILNNEFYLMYAGLSCAYDNALLIMSYVYNDNMFFNNNYLDELFINRQDKELGKLLLKFRKKCILEHSPTYWRYKSSMLPMYTKYIHWGILGHFYFFFDLDISMYLANLNKNNVSNIYVHTVDNINIDAYELDISDFLYNKYHLSINLFDAYKKKPLSPLMIDKLSWVNNIKSVYIFFTSKDLLWLLKLFYKTVGLLIYSFFVNFYFIVIICPLKCLEFIFLAFWLALQKWIPYFFMDGDIVYFFKTVSWYIKQIFFLRTNALIIDCCNSIFYISKFLYFSYNFIGIKIDNVVFFIIDLINTGYVTIKFIIIKCFLVVYDYIVFTLFKIKMDLIYYSFLKVFFIYYFINEKNIELLLKNNEFIYFFYMYYLPDYLKFNNEIGLNPLFCNGLIDQLFIKIVRNEINAIVLKTIKIDNGGLMSEIINNDKLSYYLTNNLNDNSLLPIILNNYDNKNNCDFNFKILKKNLVNNMNLYDYFIYFNIKLEDENIMYYLKKYKLDDILINYIYIKYFIMTLKMSNFGLMMPFVINNYELALKFVNHCNNLYEFFINIFNYNWNDQMYRYIYAFLNYSHTLNLKLFSLLLNYDSYKQIYINCLILLNSYWTLDDAIFNTNKYNNKLELATIMLDSMFYFKYVDLMQQNNYWNNIYLNFKMDDSLIFYYDLKVKTINMAFYENDEFLIQLVNNTKIQNYFMFNDLVCILTKFKLFNTEINDNTYICYPPFNNRLKNELFILHINESLYNIGASVYNTIFFFLVGTKKIVFENKQVLYIFFYNKNIINFNLLILFYFKVTDDLSFFFVFIYNILKSIKIELIWDNFIINELNQLFFINTQLFIKWYYYKYISGYYNKIFPVTLIKINNPYFMYEYMINLGKNKINNIINYFMNNELKKNYIEFIKINDSIKKNIFTSYLRYLWRTLNIYPEVYLTQLNYLVYTTNLNIQYDDNLNFFIYEKNLDNFWTKVEPVYNRSNFYKVNDLYDKKVKVFKELYLSLNLQKAFIAKLRTMFILSTKNDKILHILFLEKIIIKKNFIFNYNSYENFLLYFILILIYFIYFSKIIKKIIIINLILLYKLLLFIIDKMTLYYSKDYFFINNKTVYKGFFFYKPVLHSFNLYSYMFKWSDIYKNYINLNYNYYFDNITIYKTIESKTSVNFWLKNIKIILLFIYDLLKFFCFFYIKNTNNFYLHNIKYYFIYLYWNNELLINYSKIGHYFIDFFIVINEFIIIIKKRLLLVKIAKFLSLYYKKNKYYDLIKKRLLINKVFIDLKVLEFFIQPVLLTKLLEFSKLLQILDAFFFNLREKNLAILKIKEIEFWSFIGLYNDLFITKNDIYQLFRYTLDETYIKNPDRFLNYFFKFNLFFYSINKPLNKQKPIIIFDESLLDLLMFKHRNNQFNDFINLGFNLDYYLNFLKNLNKIILLFFSNNVIIYIITLNYFNVYLKLEIYLKFFSFYFLKLILIIFYLSLNKDSFTILFNFTYKYINLLLFIFFKIKYMFYLILEFINYYILFNIIFWIKYILHEIICDTEYWLKDYIFYILVFFCLLLVLNLGIINTIVFIIYWLVDFFYTDLVNVDLGYMIVLSCYYHVFSFINDLILNVFELIIYIFFFLQIDFIDNTYDYITFLKFWKLVLVNYTDSVDVLSLKVFPKRREYYYIPKDYYYSILLFIYKYIFYFLQPYWFFFIQYWPFFSDNYYLSNYLLKGYLNLKMYYQYREFYDVLNTNIYWLFYFLYLLFDEDNQDFLTELLEDAYMYKELFVGKVYIAILLNLWDYIDEMGVELVSYSYIYYYLNYRFFDGNVDLSFFMNYKVIIDYIERIGYNFFMIQSFFNFFLFFFNFFIYYSDNLYFYLNIDLIKETIFNPKNNNINLFYLPSFRSNGNIGGFYNTSEFLWSKPNINIEFIWYLFLDELKNLYFFQTFYFINNRINKSYFVFTIIYYFFFLKLIILLCSWVNNWFFMTFYNNDMSLFFSHYLNWKNYNYYKKERYYYFQKNNNVIYNDLPMIYFYGSYTTLDKFLYSKCSNFLFENKKYDLFRGRTQYMENKYILTKDNLDYVKTKDIVLNKEDYPIMNYEFIIDTIVKNQKKNNYDWFILSVILFKNYQIFWYGFFDEIFLEKNIDKFGKSFYYQFRRLYDWPLPFDSDLDEAYIAEDDEEEYLADCNFMTVPLALEQSFFSADGQSYKNTYSFILNSYWKYDINYELSQKRQILNVNLDYKLKNMWKNTSNVIIKDIRTRFFFRDLNKNKYFFNYLYYPLLFVNFESKYLDKQVFEDFKYMFPSLLPKNINIYNKYFLIEKWFVEQYNMLPLSPSFLTVLNENFMLRSLFDYYINFSSSVIDMDEDNLELRRNWNSNLIPELNYALLNHIETEEFAVSENIPLSLETDTYFLYELNNDFELLNEFDYKFYNWIFFVDNFFFRNRINPYKTDNLNQQKFSLNENVLSSDVAEQYDFYLKNINNNLFFNYFDLNKNINNEKNWKNLIIKLNNVDNFKKTLYFDEILAKDEGNYSNVKLLYGFDTNPIQLSILIILIYVPIQIFFFNYQPNWQEREHYLLINDVIMGDLKFKMQPYLTADQSIIKSIENWEYETWTGIYDLFLKLPIFLNRFFLSDFFLDYSLPWSNYNLLLTNNEVFEDIFDEETANYSPYSWMTDETMWYRTDMHLITDNTEEEWYLHVSDIAWHYTFLNLLGNKPYFFNKMSKFFFFDYNYNSFFLNNQYFVQNWLCNNNLNDFYYSNLVNNDLNGIVFLNNLIFDKKWLISYLLNFFNLIDNNNLFYFFNEKVNNNFFYFFLSKKAELSEYFDNYLLIKEHVIKFTTKDVNYFSSFNKNINIYKKYNQIFYNVNVKTLNLKVPASREYYFFDFLKLYNKSPYYKYPLDYISKVNYDLTYNDAFLKEKMLKHKYRFNIYEYDNLHEKLNYYKRKALITHRAYIRLYDEVNFEAKAVLARFHKTDSYQYYQERYANKVKYIRKFNTESDYNMSWRVFFNQFFNSLYKNSKLFHIFSYRSFFSIFLNKHYYFNNHIVRVHYLDASGVISSTYLDFFQKKWIDYNKHSILNYNLINNNDILNNFIYKDTSFYKQNDNTLFWLFDRWLSIKEFFGFFWFNDSNLNFFYGFFNLFSYFLFYFFLFKFFIFIFWFYSKLKFYILIDRSLFKQKVILNKRFFFKKQKKAELFNALNLYDNLKYKAIKKNIINIKKYKKI